MDINRPLTDAESDAWNSGFQDALNGLPAQVTGKLYASGYREGSLTREHDLKNPPAWAGWEPKVSAE